MSSKAPAIPGAALSPVPFGRCPRPAVASPRLFVLFSRTEVMLYNLLVPSTAASRPCCPPERYVGAPLPSPPSRLRASDTTWGRLLGPARREGAALSVCSAAWLCALGSAPRCPHCLGSRCTPGSGWLGGCVLTERAGSSLTCPFIPTAASRALVGSSSQTVSTFHC